MLLHSGGQYRKPDAFRFKRNGQWINVSTDEFLARVEELFFALRVVGLKPGERVAIVSENRLEWAVADYAVLCAGATTVPVYPTLSAPQIDELLGNCEPAFVFVSTPQLLEKVLSAPRSLEARHIVAFDPDRHRPGVLRLDALYETGKRLSSEYPGEFRRVALAVDPDDVATIIYTSGTTGVPKGAMLTHRNLVANIKATAERLPIWPDDLSLSFLPLSHVFQRHVDYATMFAGATTAYAESVLTVADDMKELSPTFAAGVPRFFEKVYGRILSQVSQGSPLLRKIFEKAVRIGREYVRTGHMSLAYRAADRLVFQKIRERLGGRLRFFISGGAALPQEIAEFLWAVGLPVYEGYGLSETSPVITLNGPGNLRLGYVGRVIGDQKLKLAEDGEVLVRGSNVMKGYYRLPQETAQALAGGWFHTGDVGEIEDGFLKITDRKKDLIITSCGKNMAPQPIENRLRLIPYFENVVIVGHQKNFISALIVPNHEALARYAQTHRIAFESRRDLLQRPEINDLAMAEIERRTQDLAPFEKIRKIAFLDGEFTIDGGELTPTLKVRRSAIEKKYKTVIDKLYSA
jgi:long-chain acyl-CoA synthetase